MTPRSTASLLATVLLITGAIAAGGAPASPSAGAAVSLTTCDISGKQQNLGASYVTSLKVLTVSCGKGERIIRLYHQCRHANGGAGGRCNKTVIGFACKEGARQEVPGVQYNAIVKCRKGGDKRVKSSYTQNL
jgi:hypothetical protein